MHTKDTRIREWFEVLEAPAQPSLSLSLPKCLIGLEYEQSRSAEYLLVQFYASIWACVSSMSVLRSSKP